MQHDDIAATIGVSGNSSELTADRPRNLLLFVGTSEDEAVIEDYRNAVQNAQAPELLPFQFVEGSARLGVMIPDADHTTVLYRSQTAEAVVSWLNAVQRGVSLQHQSSAAPACLLALIVGGVRLLCLCA